MNSKIRSGCPINLAVEVLGDQWSLVILRDIMFGKARHFREILAQSDEGIASNVLHTKLQRLVALDLLSRSGDVRHKQKAIYSLTEKSIQLVPVLALLGAWGRCHLPATEALSIRAEMMEQGGPRLWDEMMQELRDIHLHGNEAEGFRGKSAFNRLNEAYEAALKAHSVRDTVADTHG